eukprot:COSAG01_NODE_103_length_26263_cov_31.957728_16_plen_262_part_00
MSTSHWSSLLASPTTQLEFRHEATVQTVGRALGGRSPAARSLTGAGRVGSGVGGASQHAPIMTTDEALAVVAGSSRSSPPPRDSTLTTATAVQSAKALVPGSRGLFDAARTDSGPTPPPRVVLSALTLIRTGDVQASAMVRDMAGAIGWLGDMLDIDFSPQVIATTVDETGAALVEILDTFTDGVLLCKLINAAFPGSFGPHGASGTALEVVEDVSLGARDLLIFPPCLSAAAKAEWGPALRPHQPLRPSACRPHDHLVCH